MSTLLEEILRGVLITGTSTGHPCVSHKDGCNCIRCGNKKYQAAGSHSNWKERRKTRLQGAGAPARRAAGSAAVQREYDYTPPAPPAAAQVVLVAGHNYESPRSKMINYCFNRCKRLWKKDKTLKITIFDFTSGKTIVGQYKGSTPDWTLLTQHTAITPAHYDKLGKTHKFKGDPGVLPVTDVYKYIMDIGKSAPGSLKELSFFAHGWQGGPILVNSFDSFTGAYWKPERDPADKDPRSFKDFESPNMTATDLSNLKKAFAPDGFSWVWGCAFTRVYFLVLHQVLKSKTYRDRYPGKIDDSVPSSLSFNSLQLADHAAKNPTFFPKNADGSYAKTFTRTFREILDFLLDGMSNTYAVAISQATGVPCRSAFLGTYADYEKGVALPLMLIPRKVPPYADNFTAYVNFYKQYTHLKEDPENRGYAVYEP